MLSVSRGGCATPTPWPPTTRPSPAVNGVGEVDRAAGRLADAIAHHTGARDVATDIDDVPQQARAHTGLGHAHHGVGDATLAQTHYRHALTLYTGLGSPAADEVRRAMSTSTLPTTWRSTA
jgi:Tfp pilus assembly protein PilF